MSRGPVVRLELEAEGRCPVWVLTRDEAIGALRNVVVAVVTRRIRGPRSEVRLGPEARARRYPFRMTAKERLLERVRGLSEAEADEALRLLDAPEDPVIAAFAAAPEDDEPLTPDEEAAIDEADADLAAGRTVSLEGLERKHELG